MGRRKREHIKEKDLVGFRKLQPLLAVLEDLRGDAVDRDRGKRRTLFYDQYCALILLYFFNPIVTSLRGIQQASELKKVQHRLGCSRASLGSLSEAARVFDPDLLIEIIGELRDQLPNVVDIRSLPELEDVLTIVDGTLLRALPKMAEALWIDESNRAFKAHTQFELLKNVPTRMTVTAANESEMDVLRDALEPGRVYILDRGYMKYELFQQIIDAESGFVCRVRDNTACEVVEEREIEDKARSAGVVSDRIVRLGKDPKRNKLKEAVRLVEIKCKPHQKRHAHHQGEVIRIATTLMDVDADAIALIYRQRWQIEIFFRFFKHTLGCRRLLSQCEQGIEIQVYLGIIACMLISLWTGRKPTLRTFEMIQYYLCGMADADEVEAHVNRQALQEKAAANAK